MAGSPGSLKLPSAGSKASVDFILYIFAPNAIVIQHLLVEPSHRDRPLFLVVARVEVRTFFVDHEHLLKHPIVAIEVEDTRNHAREFILDFAMERCNRIPCLHFDPALPSVDNGVPFQVSISTVSYTHLTLPTKRIV